MKQLPAGLADRLLAAALICSLVALNNGVAGTCLGHGCDEEHEFAQKGGLLGSSYSTCNPKTYPTIGERLYPVSD